MGRSTSFWVLAVLVRGVLACGSGGADIPAPLASDLALFDSRVVERIEEARKRVASAPDSGQTWAELGMIYASERLKTVALECFRVAARLDPRQPKWPYREAVTLGTLGETQAAIAAIERSLALEPGYPPSHARLGNFRLELGDLDGAEKALREATRLDSAYPGGWVGLARVALQRDRADEAIAILERLSHEDPEDRTFRQLLGNAYRQAGRAVEQEPEDELGESGVPVWNDPWELEARAFQSSPTMLQVGSLLKNGDAAEALRLIDEEVARGGDPNKTALQRARAYQKLGRESEGMAELQRLLEREPDNTAALLVLARTQENNGDSSAAVATLERVTQLQPTHGGAFASKGRMLHALGQHELAVAALQRAVQLGVNDFEISYTLGMSLIVLKRWPEALALFTPLVAEHPEHGDACIELALARLHTGELEGAFEALALAEKAGNSTPRLLENAQRALQGARERRAKKATEGAPASDEAPQ